MVFASVPFQRRRNVRLVGRIGGLPLLAYTSKGMEVKPLIHSHCVLHAKERALDEGPPMSHVDFKKWQCRMSLSLIFPNVTCRI